MSYSSSERFENMSGQMPFGSYSTNRLINESETMAEKYNQYKSTVLNPPFWQSQKIDSPNPLQTKGNFSNNFPNSTFPPTNTNNNSLMNSSSNPPSSLLFFKSFPDDEKDSHSIQELKKVYDERILSLYNNLRVVISKLQTDDILTTMRNDMMFNSDNNEFISSRIKEILDEDFYEEKEKMIAKLSEENANLRAQLNNNVVSGDTINNEYMSKIKNLNVEQDIKIKQLEQTVNEQNQHVDELLNEIQAKQKLYDELNVKFTNINLEYTKLRQQSTNYEDNFDNIENERNMANMQLEEAKREIERLNKVISVIEMEYNSNDEAYKDSFDKLQQISAENSNLEKQLAEASLKNKKYLDENKSQQKLIEKYEKEKNEIINKYNTFHEDLQKSQREKLESYEKNTQEKMKEYKKELMIKDKEIEEVKSQNNLVKEKYNQMYKEMQENIKTVSLQWEKKLKNVQNDYESIINELETKKKFEVQSLTKKNEIEMKAKEVEMMKYKQIYNDYQNIENTYIKRAEHEEILKAKILDSKKTYEKELINQNDKLQKEFELKLQNLSEEKKTEFEFISQSLKASQAKYEKEVQKLKQANNELLMKSENDNMQNKKLNLIIDEKEKTLNILKEKVSKAEIEENKMKQFISNMTLENESLNTNLKRMKSEIQTLQETSEKIEKIKKDNSILQTENNNLKIELRNYENSHKMLNTKYSSMEVTTNKYENEIARMKLQNEKLTQALFTQKYEMQTKGELFKKVTKTKVNLLKNEIKTTKQIYLNEMESMKKEFQMVIQKVVDKASQMISNVNQKSVMFKEENEKLNDQITELKSANELLVTKEFETISKNEKCSSLKNEKIKQLQLSLNDLLNYVIKVKNSYLREFITFKSELANLNRAYQNEISSKEKAFKGKIEEIQAQYQNEKTLSQKMKLELDQKTDELKEFNDDLNKMKNVYENKIKSLTSKLESNEEAISSASNNIILKEDQINHLNSLIQDSKNKNKNLKLDLDNKIAEIEKMKSQVQSKDKKIIQLQNIVNQSLHSLNKGASNIQIANQLDDEVKQLIRTAKQSNLNDSINIKQDL